MIIPIFLILAGTITSAFGLINFINASRTFEKARSISSPSDGDLVIDRAKVAFSLVGSALIGVAMGALILGLFYLLGSLFGNASTGKYISSLHGFAKSRALLAFFGGGAKVSGGLGMAGGRFAILFSLIGPALFMSGRSAKKSSMRALNNADAQRAVSAKKAEENKIKKEGKIEDELKAMKSEIPEYVFLQKSKN